MDSSRITVTRRRGAAAGSPGDDIARRTLRLALGVVVLCGAALLCAGCSGSDAASGAAADSSTASADTSAAKPAKEEKAIKVDVAEVRRAELVMPIYADGAIRTPRSVEIRAKSAGELTEVRVRDGDRVRKGQLLARIDPRPYELDLQDARYRHFQALSQIAAEQDTFAVNDQAAADFSKRQADLERMLDEGTITRQEYQSRQLDMELGALQKGAFRQEVFEQRTGLAEARVAEERAKLNLENTEIRAPFAGIVQGLTAVPGAILQVSSPVCTIYDNERLEAVVNVLEADIGDLKPDRPVLLAVPATGDTLQTHVDVVSPTLDEASRTCEVIIRFDNPDGRFRPGMFVRAEIAGFIYRDRLQVPKAAVLVRDDRTLVFKVQGERAQWLYVDTGLENDRWTEILAVHSGGTLEPGDRVVVSDHLTLAHEARIDVRRTREPESRWDFATAGTETAQR